MVSATIPVAWAERDFSQRNFSKETVRPSRPVLQNGHNEIRPRVQPTPARARPAPARPISTQKDARLQNRFADTGRERAPGRAAVTPKPAPMPIRDWRQESGIPKEPPKPGWVLDARHRHNHYYPPRGHIVPVLPPVHHVVTHKHLHYHYHHGIWYLPHGPNFIVVLPPIGLFVPILPPFFTTVWVNSSTYYYAGGVYYNWWPATQQYVVVEAPPEEKIRTAPGSGSDPLFIYPAAGQSEEQQARDRYECHRWAQSETGFDPTLPGGGVEISRYAGSRADYQRAMKACLEARHYSVQ